ncbi:MAG: response regulator [Thermoguttaceae bacterium]|nr:response regulator [Thermoguttaceae bacterium]
MKSYKILLVDGDPVYTDEISEALKADGCTVAVVENRAAAEEALAADKYDIVITDLVMEKADSGFSLAFHIKKDKPETKVILATDVNSRHGVEFSVDSEAERAWIKADAFLNKPYRYEQLRTVIERL